MSDPTAPGADPFLRARALLLRDLAAYALDTGRAVSLLDEVLEQRRWWVQEWPDGAAFLPCLVAQDMQEALEESLETWPLCRRCASAAGGESHPHPLRVDPDLGEDPHWVCEESGTVIAPVGALPG